MTVMRGSAMPASLLVLLCAIAGCVRSPHSVGASAPSDSPILKATPADVSYVEFSTFVHDVAGRDDKLLAIRERGLVSEIVAAFQDACKRPGCPGEHRDGAADAPDEFTVHYRPGFGVKESTFTLHLEDKVWGPKVAALYKKLPLTDLHPTKNRAR